VFSIRKIAKQSFMDDLRDRYEKEGFTFVAHPEKNKLPEFFGDYISDAIAQKPGRKVVIEVKRRRSPTAERSVREIRRLFDGHPEWQLQVSFMGADPLQSVKIPIAEPEAIRERMSEVRGLIAEGHHRSAFVMAWSLLEAALRALDEDKAGPPRSPGSVVQTLAMNGYIDPDLERRIRDLIDVRNRVVHGDLDAEPSSADIEQLLSGVEETLRANVS
jgi:uncharacterized protein YutE (UPF0331/DUF86 family)